MKSKSKLCGICNLREHKDTQLIYRNSGNNYASHKFGRKNTSYVKNVERYPFK